MNGATRCFLPLVLISAGCVSMAAQDVPLVPIPPPPVGQPDAVKTVTATPASAPKVPPPAVVDVPMPAPPGATASPTVTARQLYESAHSSFQHVDSYIVRLIRREMVRGEMNPEEIILFRFRKEPWSIYFKWLGKEGFGREVAYVKGRYEGKIHSLLAAGDIPFMPAGKRMALAPDNILVRSATRHPITQAGIAAGIDKIGEFLTAIESGDKKAGTATVVGPIQRPEFEKPCYGIEHVLIPGFDPSMPRGGTRTYFFDPANGLPTLITAKDERGQEVEYYRYDRLQPGVKLDDADFDPDALWAKPK